LFKSFDYDSYRTLLNFLKRSHSNICFDDFLIKKDIKQYFILRHDVDFSLESALKMAKVEAKIGVRATYFILFSSRFYNLLSEEFCLYPRKFVELGHEVGLHYDLQIYEKYGIEELNDILENEVKMLSKLCGREVKSIARHMPSIGGEDPFTNATEFINAYDNQYYKDITYISDSCGAWRDETVSIFRKGEIPAKIQLLIHPIYWDIKPADRWTRLDDFLKEKNLNLEECKNEIIKFWSNYIGVIQHDKRK
jgi:hypothetical protein